MKISALLPLALAVPILAAQTATMPPTAPQTASASPTPAPCPVELLNVQPYGNGWDVLSDMSNAGKPHVVPPFRLKIRNTSGKEIQGIKFGAAYYDSVEDLHVIPVDWNLRGVIKVGKDGQGAWDNTIWADTASIGWEVWPVKILFTDGSKWEMSNDTLNCHGSFWKDKGNPPRSLPAIALTQAPETPPAKR